MREGVRERERDGEEEREREERETLISVQSGLEIREGTQPCWAYQEKMAEMFHYDADYATKTSKTKWPLDPRFLHNFAANTKAYQYFRETSFTWSGWGHVC